MRRLQFPQVLLGLSGTITTGVDEVQFVDQLNDFHLTQLNSSSTRDDHVLDLVITNVPTHVENISVLSPAECGLITDHSTIIFHKTNRSNQVPSLKEQFLITEGETLMV